MSEAILTVSDLHYTSKGKPVLNGLSMTLLPGHAYALLGSDSGAQTDLLRILSGMAEPDSGTVQLADRKACGFLVGEPALWKELSVANSLEMLGRILGVRDRRRMGKLMKTLHILPRQTGSRSASACPVSVRLRLGIAMALLGSPTLAVLDQPFSGLDSDDSYAVVSLLQGEMQEREMALLLTGSFFAELWPAATDFLWMEQGKITAQFTKSEIQAQLPAEERKPAELEAWFARWRKGELT